MDGNDFGSGTSHDEGEDHDFRAIYESRLRDLYYVKMISYEKYPRQNMGIRVKEH